MSVGTRHLLYPDKPGLKAFADTPSLSDYTEQEGQYGTRPGTILPHHDARLAFERLSKPKNSHHSIGVMTIEEPTKENPFGGVKLLTPLFDAQAVTPEIREAARKQAETMSDDPVQRGLHMYELLAQASRGQPVAPVPAVPQSAPAPQLPVTEGGDPRSNPVAALDMAKLAELLGYQLLQMQQRQLAAAPAPAPVAVASSAPPFVPPALPPLPPVDHNKLALPPIPPQYAIAPSTPVAPLTANPLDCLGISGLSAQAQKPGVQVTVNLGQAGEYTAYYHWALLEPKALFLVFDTRYDYPVWTPPDLGPQNPILVKLSAVTNGPSSVPCLSVGFVFMFGVFKIVMLIRTETAQ